jgi:N-acetylmuramoyl-L-alanine amidase
VRTTIVSLLASAALAGSVLASPAQSATAPLAGVTVVLDPGHQLGNANHPREINRQVDAGGFRKPCNTTGTATNGGYPESTFAFDVARRVRDRLRALGAQVVMTRTRNSRDLWGPCVDYRGKLGNAGFAGRQRDATLKLSLHGDGAGSGQRGFHLIIATKRGQKAASTRYAKATRSALQAAGFPRSTYIGGGTALDFRGDLGTLNWSHVPTFMAELGNMRNARDAAAMTSSDGRARYARALVRGMRAFLDR